MERRRYVDVARLLWELLCVIAGLLCIVASMIDATQGDFTKATYFMLCYVALKVVDIKGTQP